MCCSSLVEKISEAIKRDNERKKKLSFFFPIKGFRMLGSVSSPPPRWLGQALQGGESQFYLQSPVESSDLDGFFIEMNRQGILVNDVNHGAYNRGRITGYPVQKRLQPPLTQKGFRIVWIRLSFLFRQFHVSNNNSYSIISQFNAIWFPHHFFQE